MQYELWLGWRFLFAKRREKFISIIAALSIGGVALGVGALIVVLAVMSGFDHDMTDKLISINAHLVVDAPEGIQESQQLLQDIAATEHVVGVSPFVAGQAILRLPDRAFGVLVRGVDVDRDRRVSRLGDYLVSGRLPAAMDEAVIGTEMAAALGVRVGGTLELISPADGKTRQMRVAGLFRSGMYDYDVNLLAVRLEKAQELYHLNGVITGIGVKVDRIEHAQAVQRSLKHRLPAPFAVKTWTELNPALFGALQVEKVVMFIILTLIVVVAALNIVAMLIMIVMEKTRDIGILRALGATSGSIAVLFLAQGAAIGALGIAAGLAIGLVLAWNLNPIMNWMEATFGISLFPPAVYYLDHIPTLVNASDVGWVAGCAFTLAVLAGTYAARRAATLTPVDALRYE